MLARRRQLHVRFGTGDAYLGLGRHDHLVLVRTRAHLALRGVQRDAALLVRAFTAGLHAGGVHHQTAGHRHRQRALRHPVQCHAAGQRGVGAAHPDLVGRGQAQHAGHAAQGSCGERGGDEQALDVDAQQPGGLGRFGNGAQRAAELRAAHDVHQHGHQRERQEDDAQLDDGQVQTGNFDHFLGHG
ncbi:hypothetical protein G6F63_014446 [Rhizopus arrhizus]|nr:hypothetical protein G6F63_014446 [Rhizopus arrhizus]